jgi:hypothetical protein
MGGSLTAMKHYVLVAGVDYEFKGVNFRIFCDSRMKRIIAANKAKDDLKFITFDFRAGEIVTRDVAYPSGKKTESVSKVTRNPAITKANYNKTRVGGEDHYDFKDGQFALMSVTEVYSAVQTIGSGDPGTLHELSFFSHAWMGGPILVNSYENGRATVTLPVIGTRTLTVPAASRDPDDKDPRAPKDFGPPTMTAAALKSFQDAFHTDGFIWIWGCAFPRVDHEILHKLEHHKDYKSSGLSDSQKLTFTNFRADHILALETELGVTFPDPKKVEIEFGQLRHYFCLDSQSSYSQHIADAAKVPTFAGLMGTYSEYDKGHLPLMSVAKGFGRHLTFYQNYLGFKLDPEGRAYGEYKPGLTCP